MQNTVNKPRAFNRFLVDPQGLYIIFQGQFVTTVAIMYDAKIAIGGS